ncbi:MAG TPA: HEAT repeat domain-containing protein [Verrucomicrobiales bacterium]|nr:HEAT repeat domain-containing protein [Verrucomicrobiales bacterium]
MKSSRSIGWAGAGWIFAAALVSGQEAPRNAGAGAGFSEALGSKLAELLAQAAAEPESARYAPRMELQALSAAASAPAAEEQRALWEQELLGALPQTPAPAAQVALVRQLEIAGHAAAAPVLKSLCADADPILRDAARRALEANGSEEAAAALRQLLEEAHNDDDRMRCVHSLGSRGDTGATPLIAPLLESPDTALRRTAAAALGRIAAPEAVAALLQAYEWEAERAWSTAETDAGKGAEEGETRIALGAFRRDLAEALFRAMTTLRKEGRQEEGVAVGRRLYDYGEPPEIRASALRALVEIDAPSAEDLVIIAMQSRDSEVREAAIQSCRAYPGNRVLPNLLAVKLAQESPGMQRQMLAVLRDSGETTVTRRIGQLLESDAPEEVRSEGAEVLAQLGGIEAVGPLLERLTSGDRQIRRRTLGHFAVLTGEGVEAELLKAAAGGDPERRAAAVSALAARGAEGLDRRLLEWVREENPVRTAALEALTDRASGAVLSAMVDLCVERGEEEDFAALRSVAGRLEDREEVVQIVSGRLASAPAERKAGLVMALARAGGPAGLEFVKPMLGIADERAGAIQALAAWESADACPLILETAQSEATAEDDHVRLLQALARLLRDGPGLEADAARRHALAGLAACRRDEERRLMFSVLAGMPHGESAAALLLFLQDDSSGVKEEAASALVEIAGKMKEGDRDAANELLDAVAEAPVSDEVKKRAAELRGGA